MFDIISLTDIIGAILSFITTILYARNKMWGWPLCIATNVVNLYVFYQTGIYAGAEIFSPSATPELNPSTNPLINAGKSINTNIVIKPTRAAIIKITATLIKVKFLYTPAVMLTSSLNEFSFKKVE